MKCQKGIEENVTGHQKVRRIIRPNMDNYLKQSNDQNDTNINITTCFLRFLIIHHTLENLDILLVSRLLVIGMVSFILLKQKQWNIKTTHAKKFLMIICVYVVWVNQATISSIIRNILKVFSLVYIFNSKELPTCCQFVANILLFRPMCHNKQ